MRFRSVFESIDEGFCIVEVIFDAANHPVDYRFLQFNPVFEELTGLRGSLGRTARELVPELEEFWFETYGRVAITGESIRFESHSEPMNRWFDVHASRVGGADSRRVAIVFNNITERKLVEAERERLYAQEQALRVQAEEANRLKDEFLAVVSHELRTPLTAILGYAQLLQSRKRDETYIARAIDKVLQSAKAQAQLVEDLLDISRIVSGKLRLEPTPIDFVAVIRAALDTVRPAVEAKTMQLLVELQPEAGAVIGDPNRLQQVVWNLLSNAVKFTPQNGTIEVCLEQLDHHAQLSITDTGQGISPEFLPYLFDRFRQADSTSTRAHGGLGLGLSIVRHLVELHGGTVEASSPGLGQGATFTVQLPLALAVQPATTSTAAVGEDAGLTCPPELAGLRVLLVDDQPDILDLLSDVLLPCGVLIQRCQQAREALELLRSWQPDMLISDIAMPGEDGYWLIEQVRRLPPEDGGAIPAVALTAYVRIEDRLQVLAAGFQGYLPKPVEPAELLAVLVGLVHAHGV
ncbi:MAG: ATP-binding protein [Chloroflexaceae bacterium]|nr:ATP-binding protein [Chloroflexaceae bacterium]